MGRTSAITVSSMMEIEGCVPAVDQSVMVFFICMSRFRMTKFVLCNNGNIMEMLLSTIIVKTIMVLLHTGRFVLAHIYSSFPIDPQNFPRAANFTEN